MRRWPRAPVMAAPRRRTSLAKLNVGCGHWHEVGHRDAGRPRPRRLRQGRAAAASWAAGKGNLAARLSDAASAAATRVITLSSWPGLARPFPEAARDGWVKPGHDKRRWAIALRSDRAPSRTTWNHIEES